MERKNNFDNVVNGILQIVEEWEPILKELNEKLITTPKNIQNRNIKQIVGHLIDSASNNHQRIVRLQYNEVLIFPDYQQYNDRWIAIQDYEHADWEALIQLWKFYNLHIVQVIRSVDPTTLSHYWYNFEKNKYTLEQMIKGYLIHLSLHMRHIEELIQDNSIIKK